VLPSLRELGAKSDLTITLAPAQVPWWYLEVPHDCGPDVCAWGVCLAGAAAPHWPGVPYGLGAPGALPTLCTCPAMLGLTCTPWRAGY